MTLLDVTLVNQDGNMQMLLLIAFNTHDMASKIYHLWTGRALAPGGAALHTSPKMQQRIILCPDKLQCAMGCCVVVVQAGHLRVDKLF